MSKFKVGDKVVRKAHKNHSSFKSYMGDFAYYVITDITTSGHWLQLDNFTDGGADPYPWYADNFELYQEPQRLRCIRKPKGRVLQQGYAQLVLPNSCRW